MDEQSWQDAGKKDFARHDEAVVRDLRGTWLEPEDRLKPRTLLPASFYSLNSFNPWLILFGDDRRDRFALPDS